MPLVLGVTRLTRLVRERSRPAAADLAWLLPLVAFGAWQLVLRAATGQFILLSGVGSNSGAGLPFREFAAAVRMNLGLLWPPTGAAYIWFGEVATLAAFAGAALVTLRASTAPGYERAAFVVFIIGLGFLSADIWTGHADLRSIDECYLFAVLVLLGSRRRLAVLAVGAGLAGTIAAAHQVIHL